MGETSGHQKGHRVVEREPPRGRSRGSPRGPAPVPLPDQHRVMAPAEPRETPGRGRTLAQLADVTVDRVRRIGVKRAYALTGVGIESVADLLMHYPRRY